MLSFFSATGCEANELDGSLKKHLKVLPAFALCSLGCAEHECVPGSWRRLWNTHACVYIICLWVSNHVCVLCRGRPAVAGVVNLHLPHPQRSKLAMSRVPSPPPPAEMTSGPVAESWCYTQVSEWVCVCVCVRDSWSVGESVYSWTGALNSGGLPSDFVPCLIKHLNQPIKLLGFTWKWLAGVFEQDWN